MKIRKKKNLFLGGGWGSGPVRGGGGVRLGGQGGWEWRIEAFVKIRKKKKSFFGWGGGGVGGGGGRGVWGQGGCEWRSKVFVKIQKKKYFFLGWRGGGGGGASSLGSGWM